ncbi:hypothetical protein RMATCC62417_08046 [Rhizopus microsporus]|nr:hypothetical protein RMATCC62417_08046 [Rhizopus microsporus]
MPFVTAAIIIFIIIPSIPLFAYVIGLLVPASHIVSRTRTIKTTPSRLWAILTDVSNYPEWQPKVEKRHTVIIHHVRSSERCLLRILEENMNHYNKIPTFSGSWTFEITPQEDNDTQVLLKITEQGVMKKPIVRLMHLLLYGFHSRIDRFMNDLSAKIERENKDNEQGSSQETVNLVDHDWDLVSEAYPKSS